MCGVLEKKLVPCIALFNMFIYSNLKLYLHHNNMWGGGGEVVCECIEIGVDFTPAGISFRLKRWIERAYHLSL